MNRIILFLIRVKLGLKKKQEFYFINQKDKTDRYYITDSAILKKNRSNKVKLSHLQLNYLLNSKCQIIKE